jgi:integrase
VLGFCHWLNSNGYVTGVNVKIKTWVVNFKSDDMLNYIQRMEQTIIDAETIEVLDKERRQKQAKSLITNDGIRQLMASFVDPVYGEMFRLSLGTAMRPAELCDFPYYGTGRNSHIMPYSSMAKTTNTVDYTVLGKGNKLRTIKVHTKDLNSLERNYIAPLYRNRAEKYEKRFGKKPPLSVLFLNNKGIPITAAAIAVRTNAAKKAALRKYPAFRESISFYDARHWWPTQFLITFFGQELLSKTTDVLFAACAQVMRNQLGHESLETTYRHYIDLARVVFMAHKGLVNEIVTNNGESVEEFINRINIPDSIPVEVPDDDET